ncbi:protein of unknown function [Ruminococcaceae bacterium BL-4]|nr:protein of unknown function [Ruminococcaceae bacterium BL-4]
MELSGIFIDTNAFMAIENGEVKALYRDELGIKPSPNMQELFNKGSKL